MKSKNVIVVVSHVNGDFISYNPYKPLLVGKITSKENDYWKDNTGFNISKKNKNFCELTGLFWLWKNKINDFNVFGLNHYRRFFRYRGKILTNRNLETLLSMYDVILPKKFHWKKSVAKNYYENGKGFRNDLFIVKKIISEKYPDYLNSYDNVLSGKSASYFNMFVMKKNDFNKYCSWLFDILFEAENLIDTSTYDNQEARVFGYLSELLLNVWIEKEDLNVKYLKVIYKESVLRKVKSKLKKLLLIR